MRRVEVAHPGGGQSTCHVVWRERAGVGDAAVWGAGVGEAPWTAVQTAVERGWMARDAAKWRGREATEGGGSGVGIVSSLLLHACRS